MRSFKQWSGKWRGILLGLAVLLTLSGFLVSADFESEHLQSLSVFRETRDSLVMPKKERSKTRKQDEKPKVESFRTDFTVQV